MSGSDERLERLRISRRPARTGSAGEWFSLADSSDPTGTVEDSEFVAINVFSEVAGHTANPD